MNFDYDPKRHPPEVGRVVLDRMTALINSGRKSKGDPVSALCAAMDEIAREDGVDYSLIEAIVFGAMDRDNGEELHA